MKQISAEEAASLKYHGYIDRMADGSWGMLDNDGGGTVLRTVEVVGVGTHATQFHYVNTDQNGWEMWSLCRKHVGRVRETYPHCVGPLWQSGQECRVCTLGDSAFVGWAVWLHLPSKQRDAINATIDQALSVMVENGHTFTTETTPHGLMLLARCTNEGCSARMTVNKECAIEGAAYENKCANPPAWRRRR